MTRSQSALVLCAAVCVVAASLESGTRLQSVDSTAPWISQRHNASSEHADKEDSKGWSWKLPQTALAVLKECLSSSAPTSPRDAGACLKAVALRAMERIARAHREVPLGAGLVLVPDHKELARSLTDSSSSSQAHAHSSARTTLDEMIGNRLVSLLQGYSVRLQLPSAKTIRDAIEGPVTGDGSLSPVPGASARKRNGGLGPLLMMGSSLLPLKMSLLALLVGKALMLSMLAFAIPALRLLQSGGGGGGGSGGSGHCH